MYRISETQKELNNLLKILNLEISYDVDIDFNTGYILKRIDKEGTKIIGQRIVSRESMIGILEGIAIGFLDGHVTALEKANENG